MHFFVLFCAWRLSRECTCLWNCMISPNVCSVEHSSESAHFEKCQGDLMPHRPANYPNLSATGPAVPANFTPVSGDSSQLSSDGPLSPKTIAEAVQAAKDAEKVQTAAARDAKKTQRKAKQLEEFQGPDMSISTAGTVIPN
jgi:hypothetical protein